MAVRLAATSGQLSRFWDKIHARRHCADTVMGHACADSHTCAPHPPARCSLVRRSPRGCGVRRQPPGSHAAQHAAAAGPGDAAGHRPDDRRQVTEATGTRAVIVHYTLWLYDPAGTDSKGTRIESSRDAGRQPYPFRLGTNAVIAGFEQGVDRDEGRRHPTGDRPAVARLRQHRLTATIPAQHLARVRSRAPRGGGLMPARSFLGRRSETTAVRIRDTSKAADDERRAHQLRAPIRLAEPQRRGDQRGDRHEVRVHRRARAAEALHADVPDHVRDVQRQQRRERDADPDAAPAASTSPSPRSPARPTARRSTCRSPSTAR